MCGRSGHHAPKCRRRVKNENPSKENIVEGDDTIFAVVSLVNLVANVSICVVNSRATKHICANSIC